MSSYALKFNLNAPSPDPLLRIQDAVAKVAAQTKLSAGELRLFEAALKQTTDSGLNFNRALSETITQFAKMGPAARSFSLELKDSIKQGEQDQRQYNAELRRTEEQLKRNTASQRASVEEQLKRNTVSQMASASGVIRVGEGDQSIRAVENLLTKTLGLGSVFQALFPIAGGIAAVDILDRMVGKVGELYNAWDPIARAEQKNLDILTKTSAEFERLIGLSNDYRYKEIERTRGKAESYSVQAYDAGWESASAGASSETAQQKRDRLQHEMATGTNLGLLSPIPGARQMLEMAVPGLTGLAGFDQYITQRNEAIRAKGIESQGVDTQIENAHEAAKVGDQHVAELQAEVDKLKKEKADRDAKKTEEEARRLQEQKARLSSEFDSLFKRANEFTASSDPGEPEYQRQAREEQERTRALVQEMTIGASKQTDPLRRYILGTQAADISKSGEARAAEIRSAGDAKVQAEFDRTNEELNKEAQRRDAELGRMGGAESYLRQLRDDPDFKEQGQRYETDARISEIQRQSADRISATQTSMAISRLPLTGLSGDALIRAQGGIELGAAKSQSLRDQSEIANDPKMTAREKEIAAAEKVAKYKEQEAEIQAKMNEQMDQLLERQSEQISSGVASGAMSLLHGLLTRVPGQHESHGTLIEQLARSSAESMISGMVGNISKMVVMNSQGGGLANILPNFHGTALEPLFKGNAYFDRIPGGADASGGPMTASGSASAAGRGGLLNAISGGSKTGGDVYAAPVDTFRLAVDKFSETVMAMATGKDASGNPVAGGMLSVPSLGTGATGADSSLPPLYASIFGTGGSSSSYLSSLSSLTGDGGVSAGDSTAPLSSLFRSVTTGGTAAAAGLSALFTSVQGGTGTNPNGTSFGLPAAGFLGGLSGALGGNGPLAKAITGTASNADGTAKEELSTSQQVGAGVATAGVVATGVLTAMQQFSRGGAKGDLGGTASILGTAAALSSALPPLAMALGVASAFTGIIGSLMGNTKQMRQQAISNTLFNNQYIAPQAINVSSSTNGGYADFGANGMLRTSSLSPYPSTQAGYLDVPYRFNVPGRQTSQFGGGAAPVVNNYHVNLSAIDGPSVASFARTHGVALAEGVAHGMNTAQTSLNTTLKRSLGRG